MNDWFLSIGFISAIMLSCEQIPNHMVDNFYMLSGRDNGDAMTLVSIGPVRLTLAELVIEENKVTRVGIKLVYFVKLSENNHKN